MIPRYPKNRSWTVRSVRLQPDLTRRNTHAEEVRPSHGHTSHDPGRRAAAFAAGTDQPRRLGPSCGDSVCEIDGGSNVNAFAALISDEAVFRGAKGALRGKAS